MSSNKISVYENSHQQSQEPSDPKVCEARLYIGEPDVLFGASASDRFGLKDNGFCQTRRQWKALKASSMSGKRSFENRRRRYGLIRQNEDIRNMRCQDGNARFCQNRFKL